MTRLAFLAFMAAAVVAFGLLGFLLAGAFDAALGDVFGASQP